MTYNSRIALVVSPYSAMHGRVNRVNVELMFLDVQVSKIRAVNVWSLLVTLLELNIYIDASFFSRRSLVENNRSSVH